MWRSIITYDDALGCVPAMNGQSNCTTNTRTQLNEFYVQILAIICIWFVLCIFVFHVFGFSIVFSAVEVFILIVFNQHHHSTVFHLASCGAIVSIHYSLTVVYKLHIRRHIYIYISLWNEVFYAYVYVRQITLAHQPTDIHKIHKLDCGIHYNNCFNICYFGCAMLFSPIVSFRFTLEPIATFCVNSNYFNHINSEWKSTYNLFIIYTMNLLATIDFRALEIILIPSIQHYD